MRKNNNGEKFLISKVIFIKKIKLIHRPDVQEEMNRSLASMRVDYGVMLKNIDNSSNSLLNKRKKKATAGLEVAMGETSSTQF